MVLIDGVKFACQGCIKGHRSSKCTHNDRPLQEIKRKGRPVSQCEHCRELRKTNSVHGKCMCEGRVDVKPQPKILHNGLQDGLALSRSGTASPALSASEAPKPSRVTQLLNTCNCRSGGKCNCCSVVSRAGMRGLRSLSSSSSSSTASPVTTTSCCSSKSKRTLDSSIPEEEGHPIASTSTLPPSLPPAPKRSKPSTQQDPYLPLDLPTPYPYSFAPLDPYHRLAPAPDLLFLPRTSGTSSCFCGDLCLCVGCAQHDPLGLKALTTPVGASANGGQGCGCSNGGCDSTLASCAGEGIGMQGGGGVEEMLLRTRFGAGPSSSSFSPSSSSSTTTGGMDQPPLPLPSFSDLWGSLNAFPPSHHQSFGLGMGMGGGELPLTVSPDMTLLTPPSSSLRNNSGLAGWAQTIWGDSGYGVSMLPLPLPDPAALPEQEEESVEGEREKECGFQLPGEEETQGCGENCQCSDECGCRGGGEAHSHLGLEGEL